MKSLNRETDSLQIGSPPGGGFTALGLAWAVRILGVLLAGMPQVSHAAEVSADAPGVSVVVVMGASGEPQYAEEYAETEALWRRRCREAGVDYRVIGLKEIAQRPRDDNADGEERAAATASDREQLRKLLGSMVARENHELWLVLLGHGTFDGREAKFNLRGPDLAAEELRDWLKPKSKDLILINTTSSSAPFLTGNSGPGRIVITATKSGTEVFYTRFGKYFAEALASPEADLDEDGQTSLLETFLAASGEVARYFTERGLLATEHALLDDNGDKQGTRGDWFQGVRTVKKTKDGALPDGVRAHQVHLVPGEEERMLSPELRRRRDELELRVTELRYQKEELPEREYYRRLEEIFLKIAEIYRQAEASAAGGEKHGKRGGR